MKIRWQLWMIYLDGWDRLKPGAPKWAERRWELYKAAKARYKEKGLEECEVSTKEPEKED
ncbi:MAG: hypothetical protein APF81_24495 [Desulfosporosinus sp. BRH_c37]|nr:MAG: hypothetical protein APF81_24495 [Desulfosporosinus sp. BRH_c37]